MHRELRQRYLRYKGNDSGAKLSHDPLKSLKKYREEARKRQEHLLVAFIEWVEKNNTAIPKRQQEGLDRSGR
jgi:hypothetical protein